MKRLFTFLLLVAPLLFPFDAAAQQLERITPEPRGEAAATSAPLPRHDAAARPTGTEPIPHSGTHVLMQHPEHREALERYHREHRGTPGLAAQAAKTAPADYVVGDTETFRVWNFVEENYDRLSFTLQAITDRFYLWVETSQLGAERVRPQDVDSLKRALYDATPSGSVNPDRGIIVNDEEIFGNPPNVDGDGRTDVLLVDIQDGYDPPENAGFTAGFVTGADLSNSGNNRDILYLDTMPGIYSGSADSLSYRPYTGVASTAAHEYQHLIRFAYDSNEITFVDEGLSEYAEVLNGYPLRAPQYLADAETYNVSLLSWSTEAYERLFDYQRAALFTTYLGSRLGYEAVGELTRLATWGYATYRDALDEAGIPFEELMADFHTANLINDAGVSGPFSYPRYENRFNAAPSVEVDGRTTMATPDRVVTVESGAVQYVTWADVKDFTLVVDAAEPDRRASLRARAVLHRGSDIEVRDVSLGDAAQRFEGSFDRITLVMAHAQPNKSSAQARFSAQWNVDTIFAITNVAYDDGTIATDASGGLLYLLQGEQELLTYFEHPEEATLTRIRLPLYFYSQFGNDDAPPETATRDFTLILRSVDADGRPGEVIYSEVMDDPDPYQPLTNDIASTVQFTTLDVEDLPSPLPELPEAYFIGFANAGTDANELVFAPSPSDDNVSFLGPNSQGVFGALWDITLNDEMGTSLENMAIPIRAEFLTPFQGRLVELASDLSADVEPEHVQLSWSTQYERSLAFFVVERSIDGGLFEPLLQEGDSELCAPQIVSEGDDASGSAYTCRDATWGYEEAPFKAASLSYRLMYVYESGAVEYSPIVDVDVANVDELRLAEAFPNPTTATTAIRYELPSRQQVRLSVYDVLGRKVAVLVDEEQEGRQQITFDAGTLGAGTYFYVLEAEAGRRTGQLVVL